MQSSNIKESLVDYTGNNKEIKIKNPFNKKNNISRKKFFQRIGLLALIPISAAWYSTAERQIFKDNGRKKIIIPPDIAQGITFNDSIIIDKRGDDIKIFSSKCTHLGCKINKVENNELICPCHGSRFSYNGRPVKGPAVSPLRQLPIKVNKKNGEIIVDVPA